MAAGKPRWFDSSPARPPAELAEALNIHTRLTNGRTARQRHRRLVSSPPSQISTATPRAILVPLCGADDPRRARRRPERARDARTCSRAARASASPVLEGREARAACSGCSMRSRRRGAKRRRRSWRRLGACRRERLGEPLMTLRRANVGGWRRPERRSNRRRGRS
jgi:hypothetical protein